MFYNSGKAGVDVRNRGAYIDNNKKITRMWPHAVFCYLFCIFVDNARIILSSARPSTLPPIKQSGGKFFNLQLSRQLVRPKMEEMVSRPHLDYLLKETLHVKYSIPRPESELAPVVHHRPGTRRRICATLGCRNCTRSTCDYCGPYRCRNCSTSRYSCNDGVGCFQRRQ